MAVAQEYIGVTEVRARLSGLIESLQAREADHVYLMRNNEPVAVVMPPDAYNRIEELESICEQLEDAILVLEARVADKGVRYSLDEVLAENAIDA